MRLFRCTLSTAAPATSNAYEVSRSQLRPNPVITRAFTIPRTPTGPLDYRGASIPARLLETYVSSMVNPLEAHLFHFAKSGFPGFLQGASRTHYAEHPAARCNQLPRSVLFRTGMENQAVSGRSDPHPLSVPRFYNGPGNPCTSPFSPW